MSLIQKDGAYKVHLANFLRREGGCTLRVRSTNKVGNGERKSIWQGIKGSQIHMGTVDVRNKLPCGLQAVSGV